MADAPRVTPSWNAIASTVEAAFGLTPDWSPALTRAIELGVHFVKPDLGPPEELVFDLTALLLGLLAAGQQDRASLAHGNTATWFAAWVSRRLGRRRLAEAIAPNRMLSADTAFAALNQGYSVVLSRSIRRLLPRAHELSIKTVGRPEFQARHVFAALIGDREFWTVADKALGLKPTDLEQQALKAELVARLLPTAEPDETEEAWCEALAITAEMVAGVPPPAEPGGMTAYDSDQVTLAGKDLLETQRDADALARLICLGGAAPLAIGIFGDWGSGKSTFMERMDASVRRLVETQRTLKPDATLGAAERTSRFVEQVIQIRFNAWQFVDANLWASLTSEFFDQLRAGGWDRRGGAQHADLVERVNRHVHALTAQLETQRRAADQGGRNVLDAQQARDAAAVAVREAPGAKPGAKPGQAEVDALGNAFEAQKKDLAALGLAVGGEAAGKAVETLVDAITNSRSLVGQAGAVVRVTGASPSRGRVLSVAIAGLVAAAAWYLTQPGARETIGPALAAFSSLALAVGAAAPALRIVARLAREGPGLVDKVKAADPEALKALVQSEVALRDATAEAEARKAAVAQGAQRLARYVPPDGASNPPRLLRYVLEDDPDTKALQAEIGLIGRTRRLFHAVDQIAKEARKAREARRKAAQEGLPPLPPSTDEDVPDRIVLYIDDLDRCTEEQVYNVLQAIHLLLAFDLFVVVVGVDVKRVEDALTRALQPTRAEREEKASARQVAVRYLEKIFQIAFWLAPLSGDGDEAGGSFTRYVTALVGPTRRAPGQPSVGALDGGSEVILDGGAMEDDELDEDAGDDGAGDGGPARDPAGDRLTTIQLLDVEAKFLASARIARIAATTPRAVKRLVNIYRLVRTRLSDELDVDPDDDGWILGDAARKPLYPLIALMVALETGPSLELAEAFYDGILSLDDGDQAPAPESFADPIDPKTATGFAKAYADSPRLKEAVMEAFRLRQQQVPAKDLKMVAKIARRYSFHSYRDVPRPTANGPPPTP